MRYRDHDGRSTDRSFPTEEGQLRFRALLTLQGLDAALAMLAAPSSGEAALGDLRCTVEKMCLVYIEKQ